MDQVCNCVTLKKNELISTFKPSVCRLCIIRCGSKTDAPSGGKRAPRSPAPRRAATRRPRAARPRRTRWRTRSTTSRWTRTRTTTRSAYCFGSTAGRSRCFASVRTTSDNLPPGRARACNQLTVDAQRLPIARRSAHAQLKVEFPFVLFECKNIVQL